MKNAFARLAISLALVSIGAAATTVQAADMNGNGPGSMKDRGAHGAPVPAPVPYEEHYKYYIGAGVGWTIAATGDVGLTVGGNVIGSHPAYGGADDFRGPFVVSLVAGRYITPSLRLELGLDLRNVQRRARANSYTATLSSTEPIGPLGASMPVTNTYTMSRTDEAEVRNNTMMVNAYYDMNRGGRFNPYVGAGIGIAQLHLGRNSSETSVTCVGNDPLALGDTSCRTGSGTTTMPTATFTEATTGGHRAYGLAAALMAGFTYNLSARTHLDVGYRLMYQGAEAKISGRSLGYCSGSCLTGISSLTAEARIDHEVRTAIRWDLW